jgi:putative DNA primase/helicase
MKVTFFKDVHAKALRVVDLSLTQLKKRIETTSAPVKEKLPLIKLGTFGNEKSKRGSLRHDGNLRTINGIEVDYDGEKIAFQQAIAPWKRLNVLALAYTSPRHTPEAPRWRILFPLSHTIPPDQRAKLVARVNGQYGGSLAPESFVPSQSFYIGRVPRSKFQIKVIGDEFTGRYIDKLDELEEKAIYPPKPKAQSVEDADLDWDKVDDYRDLSLSDGAHWKLEVLWNWRDDLDVSLDELNDRLGTDYDSKNSITIELARLLKAEGWPREKIAAALMEDRPCNGHVLKYDEADRRRAVQRAVNRSFEPLVFRSDPGKAARLFLARLEQPILHFRKQWYEWTGTRYRECEEPSIDKRVADFLFQAKTKRVAKGVLLDEEPFRPKPEDVANVRKMLLLEVHIERDTNPPMWLRGKHRRDEYLISFTNGLLRVSPDGNRLTLLDHTPDYFNLATVDYAYDPRARTPKRWLQFLNQVLEKDAKSMSMAQEIFGLVLSGDRSFHTIGWNIGAPRSGKGTFLRILIAVVGRDNTASVHIGDLSKDFGLENSIGKRLLVFPDERFDGTRYDGNAKIVSELLSSSGGDFIRIGQKYKKAWLGDFHAFMYIVSNEVLRLRDESGAMAARIALLDFRRQIPPKERDLALSNTLLKELPGIFNWAMEGYSNLKARGHFEMPPRSREKMELIRNQLSRISAFVKQHCVVDPEYKADLDDLFAKYLEDCYAKGIFATDTKDSFSQKLYAAFPAVRSRRTHRKGVPNQVNVCHGIGLLPEITAG